MTGYYLLLVRMVFLEKIQNCNQRPPELTELISSVTFNNDYIVLIYLLLRFGSEGSSLLYLAATSMLGGRVIRRLIHSYLVVDTGCWPEHF